MRNQTKIIIFSFGLFFALLSPPVVKGQNSGRVILEAEAGWTYEFNDVGPVPVMRLTKLEEPKVTSINGVNFPYINRFSCDGVKLKVLRFNNKDPLFHVLNDMKTKLFEREERVGLSHEKEQSYFDCNYALAEIILSYASDYLWSISFEPVLGILENLVFGELSYPKSLLKSSIKAFYKAYKQGDTKALQDAAVDEVVGAAKGLGLIQDNSAAEPLIKLIKMGYDSLKKWLEEKLQSQTVFMDGEKDGCSWQFNVDWNLKSGKLIFRMFKTAGKVPPTQDMIFQPGSGKPGQKGASLGTIQVAGTKALWMINDVILGGMEQISEGPIRKNVPSQSPRVVFDIKKPLKDLDRGYKIDCTAVLVNKTKFRDIGYFKIENVSPKITEVDPYSLSLDPGDPMSLTTSITVEDDNADINNREEIPESKKNITLTGHPEGLKTTKKIDQWDTVNRTSHLPDKGIYTFILSRDGGDVEYPHKHEDFTTQVKVLDNNGASSEYDILIKVNDVEPEAINFQVTPDYVHRNQQYVFEVTGIFKDGNGVEFEDGPDDLEGGFVDASQNAGGDKWEYRDGLIEVDRKKDLTEVKSPQWAHTFKDEGEYPIEIQVWDGQNTATTQVIIHVGNMAPTSNAWGYIHTPVGRTSGTSIDEKLVKQCCPGDIITVGIQVDDKEGDKVKVTATILGTKQSVDLKKEAGATTHTGILIAPEQPGKYTIEIVATETDTKEPKELRKTIDLVVDPCQEAGSVADTGPELIISMGVPFGAPSGDSIGDFFDGERDYLDAHSQLMGPCYVPYFDSTPRTAPVSFGLAVWYFPGFSSFDFGPFDLSFGAGLGLGGFHFDDSAEYGLSHDSHPGEEVDGKWDFSHDFRISGAFFSPQIVARIGSLPLNTEVDAYVGIDFNFGAMKHHKTQQEEIYQYWELAENQQGGSTTIAGSIPTGYWINDYSKTEELKDFGLGFRWGLGGRWNLIRQLALGIELYGRSVRFSSWAGTRTEAQEWNENGVEGSFADNFEGMLYTYTDTDIYDQTYHGLEVFEDDPGGTAELAVINGSRWGIRLNVFVDMKSLFQSLIRKEIPAPRSENDQQGGEFPDGIQHENVEIRVIVESANIRLEPDDGSAILHKVQRGTLLLSDFQKGDWYRVILPPDERGLTRIGFIHSRVVEVMRNCH